MKGGSAYHLTDELSRLEQWPNITHISAKDRSRLHQFGPKVLPIIFLWICVVRGEYLERRHNGRRQ